MFLNLAGWVSLWLNLLLVLFSLTSDKLFEVMQLDTVHMVSLAQDGRMVASVELKEGDLDCKTNVPKAIGTVTPTRACHPGFPCSAFAILWSRRGCDFFTSG